MDDQHTAVDNQVLGERILTLVTGVLRSLELYDLRNQTVQLLIRDLCDLVNQHAEVTGGNVTLLSDEENIFMNEEFLRLDRRQFDKVTRLRKMMARMRVNEISFYPGVTLISLTTFFQRIHGGVRSPKDRLLLATPDDTMASLRFVAGLSKRGKSDEDKETLAIRLFSTLNLLSREFLYKSQNQAFPPTVRIRRVLQRMVDLLDHHGDYMLGIAHQGGREDGLSGHLARSAVLAAALARTTGMEKQRIGRAALGVFISHLPFVPLGAEWYQADAARLDEVFEKYMATVLDEGKFSGVSAWRLAILHEAQTLAAETGNAYPDDLETSFDGRIAAIATRYDRLRAGLTRDKSLSPLSPAACVIRIANLGKEQQEHKTPFIDWRLVAMFLRMAGPVPPGTLVRLTDGSFGVVRKRPEVVRLADKLGRPLADFQASQAEVGLPLNLPEGYDCSAAMGWQDSSPEST